MEFALFLPILLLLVGAAGDLGRLFHASVAIANAAKEGAAFGASSPRCDVQKAGCPATNTVAFHVQQEASSAGTFSHSAACVSGGAVVSVNACKNGDVYRVAVEHQFALITPLLVPILGNSMQLRAEADAVVLNDAFDPATPVETFPPPTPTPTVAPTPGPGEPSPTPGPSAGVTPQPSPTAAPTCLVPNFLGTKRLNAPDTWRGAGFTGQISVSGGRGNYVIGTQTLQANSLQPCNSTITVGP